VQGLAPLITISDYSAEVCSLLQHITYFPNAINRVNINIVRIPLGTTYSSVRPILGILPYLAQRGTQTLPVLLTKNGQGQYFVFPYDQSSLIYISTAIYITPTVFASGLQLQELKSIYLRRTLKYWEDGRVTVTIDTL